MRTSAFELRYSDHSLDEQQRAFQSELSRFFSRAWSTRQVRATEDGAVDAAFFAGLQELGLVQMAAGAAADDADAVGLTELLVVAEVAGRALATFPFASVWAAARLYAAAGGKPLALDTPCALPALAFDDLARPQVIAGGAATTRIVGRLGERLVEMRLNTALPASAGTCGIAFGRWEAGDAEVHTLAEGPGVAALWQRCLDEWRLVTAALSVGAATRAVTEAVQFATVRETRGVPIGSLQAIAHPLADGHIGLVAARNLARKAAWFHDREPGAQPRLARLAFVQSARAATRAAHFAIHVHGGQGVSTESDVTLAFTRACQWPLVAGDPERLLIDLGRDVLAQRAAAPATHDIPSEELA